MDANAGLGGAAAQAGRTDAIDVLSSYQDWSIANPETEPDRHREAFAEYEKAGVTGLVISSRTRTPPAGSTGPVPAGRTTCQDDSWKNQAHEPQGRDPRGPHRVGGPPGRGSARAIRLREHVQRRRGRLPGAGGPDRRGQRQWCPAGLEC